MLEMNLGRSYSSRVTDGPVKELSNAQFATYGDISTLTGVTEGTAINEGGGWLELHLDGKLLIVAKKIIKIGTAAWSALNARGCVFGTNVITIKGQRYKVRLLRGADTNPSINSSGYYLNGTHNSEWSRLFYPIVNDDARIPGRDPNAPYTMVDLGDETIRSWCQETHGAGAIYKVWRGGGSVTRIGGNSASTSTTIGWRPCLELIP